MREGTGFYGEEITQTHARVAFDAGGEVMRRA